MHHSSAETSLRSHTHQKENKQASQPPQLQFQQECQTFDRPDAMLKWLTHNLQSIIVGLHSRSLRQEPLPPLVPP